MLLPLANGYSLSMPTNVIYLLYLVKFIRSSFMATMLLFKCLLK